MSLSSDGNQGYLDIRNAILRVGTLDVYGITGVDQVTNVVKQNSVLIWDDQGSDMSTPPFQKGAGVLRSTTPPEINLVDSAGNNFMYQGLKLPNSWQGEFDLYFADASAGAINCHFYTTSTTSYADDGYELAFDRENSTVTLRYDATQVAQATGVTLSTQWHTASVTFNRGAWAVALDGDRILTLDDDERSAVYDNTTGQYVRFETAATTDRKVRYIKFLNNGAPWLESNAGHLYNLSSNVAIGVSEDDYRFSVAGTANVGALTATSVNVTGGVDATSVSTGDLTLTGLGVESNIHATNVYATNVFVGTHTEADAYDFSVHGTANTGVLTATSIVVGDETESTSVSTGALQTFALGVESNIHTNNIYSDHANTQTLEVNETVTVNANVYAKGLHLAEVASNLVTWDSTTGDLMDSGGLISNKLAIVSEQPPVALTGDSTVVDGHGRYKVTSSSEGSEPGFGDWNCFNKLIGSTSAWSSDQTYDTVTFLYDGTQSIGGIDGEWVKLELPYKTRLRHISLQARSEGNMQELAPGTFSIIGSNDDSSWTLLKQITGVAASDYSSETQKQFVIDASASYKYYALVVEKIVGGSYASTNNRTIIGEWRLFTETFTVDAGVVSTTAASGLDVGYTEHPVEPMTDYHTYVEGHGTYEASASSEWAGNTWKMFDHVTSGSLGPYGLVWSPTYNSDGTYTGSATTVDIGGTRYTGEWLQLKTPYAILLSHFKWFPTQNWEYRSPAQGLVLGSNDGENWYKLTSWSGETFTFNTGSQIDVNATTPYQYFRLVIENTGTSSDFTQWRASAMEWRLFAEKPVTRMENVHISGDLSSETLQTGYIKWPRVQLKANESEGYVASASSVYNTSVNAAPYTAFNNYREIKENGYADAFVGGNGNFTSGVANTSRTTGTDTFNHEWLQIQMPRAITLSYFTLLQRVKNVDNDNDMPKNGRMYGSNDGISWTKLVTFSDLTYERFEETRVQVNSSTPYSYYRLAVTETVGDAQVYVAVGELQLFEAATGVGAAPTSAKLQVAGSLGMAKGAEFFAGDDVVMELPKHDRPLTKYPEILLGGVNDQSLGGYVVSSSSTDYNGLGFYNSNVYNGIIGNEGWHTDGSTNASIGGVSGHWHKTEMPKAIKVKYFDVAARPNFTTDQAPRDFTILGSNDNLQWTTLKVVTNQTYTNYQYARVSVDATQYYKYLVFSIQSNAQDNSPSTATTVGEIRWWGYEEGDTSVDVVHRSIPNKPGQQHLEVYWDANDSNSYSFADSSNVYDLSGNGRTGTLESGMGFDTEYNAFTFDGTQNAKITGSITNQSGDWTHSTSFWVKIDTLKNVHFYQIGPETTNYDTTALYYNTSGYFQTSISGGGANTRGYASLVKDRWYHIVVVKKANAQDDIYLNSQKLSGSYTSGTQLSLPQNTSIILGYRPADAGVEPLDGSIANFRLFGKVLNADQIRELYEYDAPRFGHRQNLVALHKGNLGVGVAHPTSRFEVAGTETLQEYPPKEMTANETYIEGHGVFRASASTSYTDSARFPYHAFDKSSAQLWLSIFFQYNSDGDYTGDESLGGISGEWIKLSMPYKTRIKRFKYEATDSAQRDIALGTFLGSNDESTWFPLARMINPTGGSLLVEVNATDAYAHYALVAEKDVGGNEGYAGATELRLFGTPAPSSLEDGHMTLGKALTLPRVSGHPAGAETPRAESLVLHYDTTVDSVVSGSTAVVDTSGNGINGNLVSGAAYSSTDRAFSFDGSNDYGSGTLNNSSGAWVHSVSCWYKPLSTTEGIVWAIGTNASGKQIAINNANGAVRYFIYGCDSTSSPTATFTTNKWHHIVAVFRNSETTTGGGVLTGRDVYIDGVKQTMTAVNTQIALNLNANTTFRLANQYNSLYNHGSISNFKIWDVALTAEEVAMEYALGRTGKSINLTDTALCLGGTAPRTQLDVRGGARFDGYTRIGEYDFEANSSDISRVMLDARGPTRHMGILLPSTLGNNYTHPPLNIDHDSNPPPWEIRSVGGVVANRYNPNAGDGLLRLRAGYYLYPSWIDLTGYNQAGDSQTIIFGTQGTERMRIRHDGNVGIGSTNPNVRFTIKQSSQSSTGGLQLMRSENTSAWQIYINSDGTDLYFAYNGGTKGFLDRFTNAGQIDFTGQHRSFIDNVPYSKYIDLEGLIVSANKNKYFTIDESIQTGSNAIQISESLPLVSLSTKEKDKACFGVISGSEDPESRKYSQGSFVTVIQKQKGDQRALINSVGEGAMWVTNINGPLESGDYITTSNVAGYGQRQDDDVLHNYTVAKITMDCDFNPPDIPVQRIIKELANVTYWYQLEDATSNAYDRTQEETYYTKERHIEVHGHVDEQSNVFVPPDHDLELYSKTQVNTVSEEVYNALPEDEQALYDSNTFTYTQVIGITPEVWADLGVEEQNTYAHGYFNIVTDEVPSETPGAVKRTRTVYKNVVNETKVEPVTPEDYLSEVREEWVNVLDENDQIQWEDVPWGDTEPAYKLRYLDAEGQITTRHNAVHTAAFVGVTYHCG
jgi:hypothetical protein